MKITSKESGILDISDIKPSIIFHDDKNDEFIKIEKGKFFYKGKEIDDIHNVYERFSDWLNIKNI